MPLSQPSLRPRDWKVTGGCGIALRSAAVGFEFDVPIFPLDVDYLTTAWGRSFAGIAFLHLELAATLPIGVSFKPSEGTDPQARARLILRRYDPETAYDVNNRWWSNPLNIPMPATTGETIANIAVPLTADNWTNIEGQRDEAAFATTLAKCQCIGLTFGGQFFGHGIGAVGGPAKINVRKFYVS